MPQQLKATLLAVPAVEETGFLPYRLIASRIFTLRQLLKPPPPPPRQICGGFLPGFAKAYDTVHRGFQLKATAELGMSEQLCKWVQFPTQKYPRIPKRRHWCAGVSAYVDVPLGA